MVALKKRNNKRRDLLNLVLLISIIIVLNIISSFIFQRIDLTSEKRYTLSDNTKTLLKNLDDVVYFKVYLEGDFPAGFDRLKNATREMLDEFRIYSGSNIEYEFINPGDYPDKKQVYEVYQQLANKGITPHNIEVNKNSGSSENLILFPGAIVSYKGRERSVQLFKDRIGYPSEVVLNNSIEGLEYELSNVIRKLQTIIKPKVAFIKGQYEMDSISVADLWNSLNEYYTVEEFHLTGKYKEIEQIREYKSIIVARPDSAFSEQEKYILDQYIMNGGKALWLIDNVQVSMDSLRSSPMTYGMQLKTNLDDMFFNYGVRINTDLIQDLKCGYIPLPVNNRYQLFPWLFFPLVDQGSNHPVCKNINAVKTNFVSSMDTLVTNTKINKTVLLRTSEYSNTLIAPVRVDLRIATKEPAKRNFRKSNVPVAILLEGEFESVYKNRITPGIDSITGVKFTDRSTAPNKMIIISDGDMARNYFKGDQAYPLGFDIMTNQTYGNKTFLLNAINYLNDDQGMLSVRSREIVLRILDVKKVQNSKTQWQVVNVLIPIILIVFFGIILNYTRKKKYNK